LRYMLCEECKDGFFTPELHQCHTGCWFECDQVQRAVFDGCKRRGPTQDGYPNLESGTVLWRRVRFADKRRSLGRYSSFAD
jgi:hypothetical protein